MRFTEHELTVALTAAAKPVAAAQKRGLRKGRQDPDAVWSEMTGYERYQVLDALSGQPLPALVALPDVEVATGARAEFADAQVLAAVEEPSVTRPAADASQGRRRCRVAVLRPRWRAPAAQRSHHAAGARPLDDPAARVAPAGGVVPRPRPRRAGAGPRAGTVA